MSFLVAVALIVLGCVRERHSVPDDSTVVAPPAASLTQS